MKLKGLLLLLLLGTMVPLTPMAYASPPDPVWVKGFFDDADYDDVVVLITSSGATVQPFPLDSIRPVPPLLASVSPVDEAHAPFRALSSTDTRAPPAA